MNRRQLLASAARVFGGAVAAAALPAVAVAAPKPVPTFTEIQLIHAQTQPVMQAVPLDPKIIELMERGIRDCFLAQYSGQYRQIRIPQGEKRRIESA